MTRFRLTPETAHICTLHVLSTSTAMYGRGKLSIPQTPASHSSPAKHISPERLPLPLLQVISKLSHQNYASCGTQGATDKRYRWDILWKRGHYPGTPATRTAEKTTTRREKQANPSHLVGPQKYRRLRTIPPAIASSQLPTFSKQRAQKQREGEPIQKNAEWASRTQRPLML